MLMIYIAGSILNYSTTPKIMLLLPATFLVLIYFFPETPVYLLRNSRSKEAEASLKFLRGYKRDAVADDVNIEIQKMIRKINIDAMNHHRSGHSDDLLSE